MIVSRAKAEEAWDVLRANYDGRYADIDPLKLPSDEDTISRVYRVAAQKTHPDAGGGAEAFAKVDWAKHALLKWIKQGGAPGDPDYKRKDCVRCDGKGYTQSWQGLRRGPRVQCARCKGTGDADYEPDINDGVTL